MALTTAEHVGLVAAGGALLVAASPILLPAAGATATAVGLGTVVTTLGATFGVVPTTAGLFVAGGAATHWVLGKLGIQSPAAAPAAPAKAA